MNRAPPAGKPATIGPAPYEDDDVYALQAVVNDPNGKKALDWIINHAAGTYETSAVPGDPHMTYFNEGRRSVGRQIVYLLKLNMAAVVEVRRKREPRK